MSSMTDSKTIPFTQITGTGKLTAGESVMLLVIPFIIFLIIIAIQFYIISAAVARGTFKALEHASAAGIKTI
jgi:hypothetical protein